MGRAVIQVLLCEGLERIGLDLEAIKGGFGGQDPEVRVQIQPGPCCDKEWWQKAALTDAIRLVLGLCTRDYSTPELEARARKGGLDPFGVEVVELGPCCAQVPARPGAAEKAKILLKAACARAAAFRESRPDSVKPVLSWDHRVSRRGLFTLPPLRYEPVASVRKKDCASEDGCRVCAMACPRQALSVSDDGPMICDKSQCTGCGACVSACPHTAIDLPGFSPQQIEAQIATLLEEASLSSLPWGLLFVCKRSAKVLVGLAQRGLAYPAAWLPVELPCIGMVTPTWLLHCLSLGAAGVGVLPCGSEDCRFGNTEDTKGKVDYCREFLSLVGASPDLVRLLNPHDEQELARDLADLPERAKNPRKGLFRDMRLFGPLAASRALLGIAEQFAPSLDSSLEHAYSPVGMVNLRSGCTACEACIQNCPTGALTMYRDEDGIALSFESGLCIACESCVPVCPERSLQVKKVTSLSHLAKGESTLYRDSEIHCKRCGSPVASGAMLGKITALLGSDPALSAITRYCLSCRGVMMSGHV